MHSSYLRCILFTIYSATRFGHIAFIFRVTFSLQEHSCG